MNLSSIRYNRRNEEELIDIVKEMYKERINNLSGHDLLKYIEFIVENTEVASFIEENKDKVVEALSITDPNLLHTFLVELDSDTKKTALVGLTKDIINPNTLNKVISSCTLDSIVSLYNKDKELFKKIDIESLVKAGNKDFMCKAPLLSELLDSYKLDSIEFLNKTLYRSYFTSSLNLVASHIEKRFRDSLIIDGKLETIDDSTTIFSTSYLKNLKEIHELKLDSTSPIYMAHLKVFVKYLTGKEIIDIPNNIADISLIRITIQILPEGIDRPGHSTIGKRSVICYFPGILRNDHFYKDHRCHLTAGEGDGGVFCQGNAGDDHALLVFRSVKVAGFC